MRCLVFSGDGDGDGDGLRDGVGVGDGLGDFHDLMIGLGLVVECRSLWH